MSPILVRPVREQLEHDRVIRLLQQDLARKKVEVTINPGTEQNASVGGGSRKEFPDAVVYSVEKGRKVIGVVEVETAESVNHLEAMSQWAHLARLRVPFHLYVPLVSIDAARRLSHDHAISVTEIWSYHQVGDQFRFTQVHPARAGRAAAAAPRTVSVASIRVEPKLDAVTPEVEPARLPVAEPERPRRQVPARVVPAKVAPKASGKAGEPSSPAAQKVAAQKAAAQKADAPKGSVTKSPVTKNPVTKSPVTKSPVTKGAVKVPGKPAPVTRTASSARKAAPARPAGPKAPARAAAPPPAAREVRRPAQPPPSGKSARPAKPGGRSAKPNPAARSGAKAGRSAPAAARARAKSAKPLSRRK